MASVLGSQFRTDDYQTTITESYTCHSGSNRRFLVITDTSADSVTYNSESLTYEGTCTLLGDPVKFWFLPESQFPGTPGAYNFVSTIGTSQVRQILIIVEFDSAQQDALDRYSCSWTEYAAAYSQTVVYNDSLYMLDVLFSVNGNTLTAQSSQTGLINGTTNDGRRWVVGGLSVSTTSPDTIASNWTQSAATILYSVRIPVRDFSESEVSLDYYLVKQHTDTDQSGSASTSITATTDSSATSGNLLLFNVFVDKNSGGFNAITDWTQVEQYNYANGSSGAMFWREADGTATDNSVQSTWSTSEQSTAYIEEWGGATNGWQLLDSSVGGSDATAVTSISTGTTGTISDVPAIAITNRSTDSNLVINEYPFLTNEFEASNYQESTGNYTIQGQTGYSHILTSGTVETTWSDPAGSSVRQCAIVGVFSDTGGASVPTASSASWSNAAETFSGSGFSLPFGQSVALSNQAQTLSATGFSIALSGAVDLQNAAQSISATGFGIPFSDSATLSNGAQTFYGTGQVVVLVTTAVSASWTNASQQFSASGFSIPISNAVDLQNVAQSLSADGYSIAFADSADLQNGAQTFYGTGQVVAIAIPTAVLASWENAPQTIDADGFGIAVSENSDFNNAPQYIQASGFSIPFANLAEFLNGAQTFYGYQPSLSEHTYRIKLISEDRTIKLLSEDRTIRVIS